MKRFQSAFAAPSGFVVAAKVGKGAKAARRGETVRTAEMSASVTSFAKPRTLDLRDRAA